MPPWAQDLFLEMRQVRELVLAGAAAPPLEILAAALVLALVISAFDNFAALIYAVLAAQARTLLDWAALTVIFLVYWLYRGVMRAIKG